MIGPRAEVGACFSYPRDVDGLAPEYVEALAAIAVYRGVRIAERPSSAERAPKPASA